MRMWILHVLRKIGCLETVLEIINQKTFLNRFDSPVNCNDSITIERREIMKKIEGEKNALKYYEFLIN